MVNQDTEFLRTFLVDNRGETLKLCAGTGRVSVGFDESNLTVEVFRRANIYHCSKEIDPNETPTNRNLTFQRLGLCP